MWTLVAEVQLSNMERKLKTWKMPFNFHSMTIIYDPVGLNA